MKNLKRYLRLYKALASQFLKMIVQSKVDFIMGLFGFLFSELLGLVFLVLVFRQIPDLQGWTFDQLVFIYGFAQIPRGIDHLFTDNIWLVAWRYVINGSFDRYMLRPMNVFFQVISEKLQPDALGELLIGFTLVGISLGKGIVIVDFAHVVLFIVSVIAGAIIYTSIKLFFATIAFWVKISGPFLQVAYDMAQFAKYPTEIYAKPIKFIITWIIPFAFVAYLPASYFLMVDKSWLVIVVECVIALVFWVVAYGFFNYGISRYESAGN